jgi:hypothetical protein
MLPRGELHRPVRVSRKDSAQRRLTARKDGYTKPDLQDSVRRIALCSVCLLDLCGDR